MELTLENVKKLLGEYSFEITEEAEGIRIKDQVFEFDEAFERFGQLPSIMKAALALQLDPDQLEDNSVFEQGTYWSTLTGKDSDIIYLDVLFKFK